MSLGVQKRLKVPSEKLFRLPNSPIILGAEKPMLPRHKRVFGSVRPAASEVSRPHLNRRIVVRGGL